MTYAEMLILKTSSYTFTKRKIRNKLDVSDDDIFWLMCYSIYEYE